MKGGIVLAVGLAVRAVVVLLAKDAIPPSADGTYYHLVASRIADGLGYTWLWPDGAVTYAAHYPVGYPAIVGAAYALFGKVPAVAMVINAVIGALGAASAYALLARTTGPRLALFGGLAVALHPALVPYTAALMTEGVTASLLTIAAATAAEARAATRRGLAVRWTLATGVALGVCTLVRPQVIVFAPIFGLLAWGGPPKARACAAASVLALALAVCAPWTVRNCARMGRCALVSVNGGWNLAIGTQTRDGGWAEVAVPDACKEVFGEADKDACFGREAVRTIARAPLSWIARAPAKVRMTFDYFGAAPWYLHAASPTRFPHSAKLVLGGVETLASRLLLAAALASVGKTHGPRRRARWVVVAVGLLACVVVPGALAYLALAVAILLLGVRGLLAGPPVLPVTAAVILATAATHAVFFGSGRYGLLVVPFVSAIAFFRPMLRQAAFGGMVPVSTPSRRSPEERPLAVSPREESPSSVEHDAG